MAKVSANACNKTPALPVSPSAIEPVLLSIPQAAHRLGATVSAIRGLIWDGELPYVALGQRHMVRVVDLDAWVSRNLTRNGAVNGAKFRANRVGLATKSNP